MRPFKEIKSDYRFSDEHQKWLVEMRPLMEENAREVMNTLDSWILGNKEAAKFFVEESRKRHVFEAQRQWFLDLFSGVYDRRYYERLIRIGAVHVKNKVDPHFMSRAINIVRDSCIGILSRTEESKEELTNKIISLGKILDISHDVITLSYIEEEIKSHSPAYKVRSALIDFSEKFAHGMNFVLVMALIGLTLGVIWLFAVDVLHLVSGEVRLGEGIISALGSMLMLWVMMELMNTEISHLKGGKFQISVFVGVALVTIIRDTMIAILRHEKPETVYYLVAAILAVGVVYWLVWKTETKTQ